MSLVTRLGKGSRLTVEEMDGNFLYLQDLAQSNSGQPVEGPHGPQGIQGPTGPQGLLGPVGPNIQPSGLVYVKTGTSSWVSLPITTVS